jgi:hypothetical protein
MMRKIYEIAEEIEKSWVKNGKSNVWFGARDYLDAMHSLEYVTDVYFADTAKDIVLYFLSNATTWRGEDARRIKAELKSMLASNENR